MGVVGCPVMSSSRVWYTRAPKKRTRPCRRIFGKIRPAAVMPICNTLICLQSRRRVAPGACEDCRGGILRLALFYGR